MADELLCKDGLQISEVTTDPDSSAGRAADSSTRTAVCCKISPRVSFVEKGQFSKTFRKSNKKYMQVQYKYMQHKCQTRQR